jgi:hypothetical protein
MIDDIVTEVMKITVHALTNKSIRKEVIELEKDTKFPIGFYQNLRKHGVYVHRSYDYPWN